MNLQLDIQSASSEPSPDEDDIRRWMISALDGRGPDDSEVSLRLVDIDEMAELNQRYRNKAGPTNVLSFPSDLPPELELPLLGDIVICVPVVRTEAEQQGKPLQNHWAHLTIHGTLHLLGYDHIEEHDAREMEALETAILANLGIPCPYTDEHFTEHAGA